MENQDDLTPWIDASLEARLVALVLGEASDFEREELERLMEERPELEVFVEQIQAIHGQLTEISVGVRGSAPAVDGEPDVEWRLEPKARAELLSTLGGKPVASAKDDAVVVKPLTAETAPLATKPSRKVNSRLWRLTTWAAAACIVICAGVLSILVVASKDGEANWMAMSDDYKTAELEATRQPIQSLEIPNYAADSPAEPTSSLGLLATKTAPTSPDSTDSHWAYTAVDAPQPNNSTVAPGGIGGGGGGIALAQSGQQQAGGGGDAFAVAETDVRLMAQLESSNEGISNLTREGDISVTAGNGVDFYAGRRVGGKVASSNSLEFGGAEFKDANGLGVAQVGNGSGDDAMLGLKLDGEKSAASIEERLMDAAEDDAESLDVFGDVENDSLRLDYGIPVDGKKVGGDRGRANFNLGFRMQSDDASKGLKLEDADEAQLLDRRDAPGQKVEMAKADPIHPRFGLVARDSDGDGLEEYAPMSDLDPIAEVPFTGSVSVGHDTDLIHRGQNLGDMSVVATVSDADEEFVGSGKAKAKEPASSPEPVDLAPGQSMAGDGDLAGGARIRAAVVPLERQTRQLPGDSERMSGLADNQLRGGQEQSLSEFSAPSRLAIPATTAVTTPSPDTPEIVTAAPKLRSNGSNKGLDDGAEPLGEYRWAGASKDASEKKNREFQRAPARPAAPIAPDVVTDQFGAEYLPEELPSGVKDHMVQGNSQTKDKVVRRELSVDLGALYDSPKVSESKRKMESARQVVESKPEPEPEPEPMADEARPSFGKSVSKFFSSFGRPERSEAETPPPPAAPKPASQPTPAVAALGPAAAEGMERGEREVMKQLAELSEEDEAEVDISVSRYRNGLGEDTVRSPGEIIVDIDNGTYSINGQVMTEEAVKVRLAKVENIFPNESLYIRENGEVEEMEISNFATFTRQHKGGANNLRGFDYAKISQVEFPELQAAVESTSTFSLHVSDVSYKLAQAALAEGQWPEKKKVRIEEFVNAFDYGDPMPDSSDRVACEHEQAIHPFYASRNLLRISMRTAATGRSSQTPLRLTLLLDYSGSMERADRRESIQKAFALLAQQLHAQDQVTLIGFAREPKLLAENVPGPNAGQALQNLVANTASQGGTNLEAALRLAFEKAQEQQVEGAQNRIVLITDGAANLGDAQPERLGTLVENMREKGIAFDAAGVGAEGLNDEILEALTRKGDGRYYFLNRPEDADDGFAKQIAGALRPAAKNVKVQVEFNPNRVGRYKLLGFEKHRLKKEDFRNDAVDAAEMAAAEAGVALYQFEPLPEGDGDIGFVSVRFRDMSTNQMVERRWPIPYEPTAARINEANPSIRIAGTAALFAAKLKDDPVGEAAEYSGLSKILTTLPQSKRDNPRVQQLQEMIEQARRLKGGE